MITIAYLDWESLSEIKNSGGKLYAVAAPSSLQLACKQLVNNYLDNHEVEASFLAFRQIVQGLFVSEEIDPIDLENEAIINDLLVEMEWLTEEPVQDSPAYIEAQLMSYSQLIASRAAYLIKKRAHHVTWMDARDYCITNEIWLSADILMEPSSKRWNENPMQQGAFITANQVGATADNENTIIQVKRSWDWILNL